MKLRPEFVYKNRETSSGLQSVQAMHSEPTMNPGNEIDSIDYY